MQAEQMLDAVSQATEVAEKFPGFPLGTPAVLVPDGEFKHPWLEVFGRPARAMACECERDPDTNLSQALLLVGGNTFHEKLSSPQGRIARLIAAGRSDAEIVEELFLAGYGRPPSDTERKRALAHLATAAKGREQQAAEDVLWAILNSKEFMFNH